MSNMTNQIKTEPSIQAEQLKAEQTKPDLAQEMNPTGTSREASVATEVDKADKKKKKKKKGKAAQVESPSQVDAGDTADGDALPEAQEPNLGNATASSRTTHSVVHILREESKVYDEDDAFDVASSSEAPAEATKDVDGKEEAILDAAEDTDGKAEAILDAAEDTDQKAEAILDATEDTDGKAEAILDAAEDTDGKAEAILDASEDTDGKAEAILDAAEDTDGKAEAILDAAEDTDGKPKAVLEEWQTVYNKFHLKEPIVTVREPAAKAAAQDGAMTELEAVPHKQSASTREVSLLGERLSAFEETQAVQMQKLVYRLEGQLEEQLRRSQEDQQLAIKEAVAAQVHERMKGVSNLQRMEEHTNAAVGRVEMMELMMLKREMAQELPHLRTLRSTVHGLNDRVKALEVKQNLMRQNLEIAMQAMRAEVMENANAQADILQSLQKQQDNDIRALSQVMTMTNNANAEATSRVQKSLHAHEVALKRHMAKNDERWPKMVTDLHEEVETMREHMRGSMRAMVVDIGDVRQKMTGIETNSAEVHRKLAMSGSGSVDMEHVAKTQVETLKRNVGNNIMAVSDSLSYLQQRVGDMEDDRKEAAVQHQDTLQLVQAQLAEVVRRLDTIDGQELPPNGPESTPHGHKSTLDGDGDDATAHQATLQLVQTQLAEVVSRLDTIDGHELTPNGLETTPLGHETTLGGDDDDATVPLIHYESMNTRSSRRSIDP